MNSNFITVEDNNFHILSEEDGEIPVVMAHGFTDNAMCMTPLMEKLPFDSRGIAYDAKAHGLSDAPNSGYGKQDMADDLVGVVRKLELDNPVLYGHSLGANTVARASQALDDVRFCVLEDPAGLIMRGVDENERSERETSQFKNWRTSTHREIKEQYVGTPRFADLLATARKQMRPEALNINDRGYDYIGDFLENPPETLLLRPDPTVVDYDVSDQDLPSEVSVNVIPNASHTIFRDNQKDFIQALDDFLYESYQ